MVTRVVKGPRRARHVWFYYVYFAFTLGVAAVVLIPQDDYGNNEDNQAFILAWVAVQALSLLFLLARRRHSADFLVAVLIGGYAVSSTLWSVAPAVTLQYSAMLAMNIVTAYQMSLDLSLSEIVRMLAKLILTLTVLSLIFSALGYTQLHYYDVHGRTNALGTPLLRGFFPHKVMASLYVSLGTTACLHVFRSAPGRVFAVLAGTLFVFQTGSATGEIIFPLTLLAYFMGTRIRNWRVPGNLIVLLVAALGVLGLAFYDALSEQVIVSMGRDVTLTGRTHLWAWGLKTWLERFWFGWGYNGYLHGPNARDFNAAVPQMGNYEVPHFHNSYIQTAADLGVVGLVILLWVLASALIISYRLLVRNLTPPSIVAFTMMVVMIVASPTMFLFFHYNHFATFLLFVLFFALRRYWRAHQCEGGLPGKRDRKRRSTGRGGYQPNRRIIHS